MIVVVLAVVVDAVAATKRFVYADTPGHCPWRVLFNQQPCGGKVYKEMIVRLYVGNLPFEMNDAGLRDLLAPFGRIDEAAVVTNGRNKSRGFGFATLQTDTPDEVIGSLDGRTIEGRALQVRPAHAPPSFQRAPRPFGRDQGRGRPRRDD